MDKLARLLDARPNERIYDGRTLNQIDRAPERLLQGFRKPEELLQRRMVVLAIELDEKIGVARLRIEVHAHRRAKDFQPPHAEAATEGDQVLALGGDVCVHDSVQL